MGGPGVASLRDSPEGRLPSPAMTVRGWLAQWPRFRYRPRRMTRTLHHRAHHHHRTLGGPGGARAS